MRAIILAVVSACFAFGFTEAVTANFMETGDCQEDQLCSYFYSVQQEYVNSGEQQLTKVNAIVDLTCTSSGTYNGSNTKLFCMVIKNPTIFTSSMENSTEEEIRATQQSISEQLGNWFCFVQSKSGKISAVYHPPSEPDHVVNLKKSISAAFQANFEGTEEEDEVDPQSQHRSHYSYTPTTEEGLLKMHRKIRKLDVTQLSGQEKMSDDLETAQDEDIQYRSGRLERSSGNTSFNLANNSNLDNDGDLEPLSLSQTFAANGSYAMELRACRRLNKYMFSVQKRKILYELRESLEEGLGANLHKKRAAFEEMKNLREGLPSGSATRALENYNNFGDKLVPNLQILIELESQYGTLPNHTPVLQEIMNFIPSMPKSESDRQVRDAVLMLLSAEGSLRSQMALLSAYDNAMDDTESNVILTYISFLKLVKVGFIIGMEERLERPTEDPLITYQLLLVFSSLATKGSAEVEDRVMEVLGARTRSLIALEELDLTETKVLLHALGNTGSKLSIPLIFSILEKADDDYEMKLVTIEALEKVTDDPVVLSHLNSFLQDDSSVDCVSAVIETLQTGYAFMKENEQDLELYSNQIKSHPLLYTLVKAVSNSNDTDIHSMMEDYLHKIKAGDSLIFPSESPLGKRGKRGTRNWDSSNSDYDYVDSLVDRQTHVSTYPRHSAYLNAHRIGINEANIKIAYGYFAGTNTHCDKMKAFGRCVVVGTLLSKSHTLADVKLNMETTTGRASIVVYARIGSNTLLDYSFNEQLSNHCYQKTHGIASFRRRIFTLSYRIFVYVGYLRLHIGLTAHFDLSANTNICIGRTGTEVSGALGALTPTVGVTIDGGVTGNLLGLVRGGITLSASFNYRLELAASIQGCTAYCTLSDRVCVGIYGSSPNNNLDLETWYQLRAIRICGSGWFRYPCIGWGRHRRINGLSKKWDLPTQPRKRVWEKCFGNLDRTCTSGVLSSPLFSY